MLLTSVQAAADWVATLKGWRRALLAAFAGASMAARPSGIGRTLDAALVAIAALKTFAAPPAAVERRDSS